MEHAREAHQHGQTLPQNGKAYFENQRYQKRGKAPKHAE